MKTSSAIASLLFGSFAAAVPFKRDLVTKTELVVETVVITTTVWDNEPVPTAATTTPGAFYEQSSQPASSVAQVTSTYVAPVVQPSSSVYVAPSSTVVLQPESTTSVYTPPPAPTSQAPVASSAAYTPSPVSSAPAAASSASTASTGSGQSFSDVDLTVYDTEGGTGMCGTSLSADAMTVALAADIMGERITDPQTGNAMNEMCGKKIAITYGGNTIEATINDRCPGCVNGGLDLTRGAMKALVGTDASERYYHASWNVIG